MIPVGDIAAVVEALGFAVAEYRRERVGALLKKWAILMQTPDSDQRSIDIRQFAQDRTQERGFTPWYEGTEHIGIPKDLLCDIMDLLIDPMENAKGAATKFLDSARRAMGFKSVAEKDRIEWADLIDRREPKMILNMLEEQTARRGRSRAYSASPVIDMDIDWVADAGCFLISG